MRTEVEREKLIDEIINFFDENTDEEIMDIIQEDLKIDIDNELSCLYDEVNEKKVNVSFEEIIIATINRVKIAIETFKKDEEDDDEEE